MANRSGLSWKSGVTTSESLGDVNAFGSWRGRPVDISMLYTDGNNWGKKSPLATAALQWNKVLGASSTKSTGIMETYLDAGIHVCFAQAMMVVQEKGQFQMISTGGRDAEHIELANNIASWYNYKPSTYPRIYICFGQEASTTTYPWSIGNSTTGVAAHYIDAYRRVAQIYKDRIGIVAGQAPPIIITWNGLWKTTAIGANWPGNDMIDVVTIDPYDDGYNGSWFANATQFQTWLGKTYDVSGGWQGPDACRRFAASKGKKFGVQEWGASWSNCGTAAAPICPTTGKTPDTTYYVDGMWQFFEDNASELEFEIYFNNSIESADCGNNQQHMIHPEQSNLTQPSRAYVLGWTPPAAPPGNL